MLMKIEIETLEVCDHGICQAPESKSLIKMSDFFGHLPTTVSSQIQFSFDAR